MQSAFVVDGEVTERVVVSADEGLTAVWQQAPRLRDL